MKQILLAIITCMVSYTASAQFVAQVEVPKDIEGICDADSVFYLLDQFNGQLSAKCDVSDQEINMRLKTEVTYAKNNPKFKAEGMIYLTINCEGELVDVKIDTTKSDEFDAQMLAFYESLTQWKPAKLYKDAVDSQIIISFKVKKGKLEIL